FMRARFRARRTGGMSSSRMKANNSVENVSHPDKENTNTDNCRQLVSTSEGTRRGCSANSTLRRPRVGLAKRILQDYMRIVFQPQQSFYLRNNPARFLPI